MPECCFRICMHGSAGLRCGIFVSWQGGLHIGFASTAVLLFGLERIVAVSLMARVIVFDLATSWLLIVMPLVPLGSMIRIWGISRKYVTDLADADCVATQLSYAQRVKTDRLRARRLCTRFAISLCSVFGWFESCALDSKLLK